MAGGTDSAFAGGNRAAITACAIIATLMQALDTTIANVALPYMQGSVSASQDQIDWVLTSYIVAAAIMTPPTGFLAGRFGLKNLFLASITGFTIASMLCGMAQSVTQIVLFRVLQGAFGAALVPLSQSVLLSTYPRERQGFAMALFGMGVMVGPVLGPVLGGWLTEHYSWRWCSTSSADRDHCIAGNDRLSAGDAAQFRRKARLARLRHTQSRDRRPAGHARSRRAERLVHLRRNHDRRHRRGLGVLSVPGAHFHG
jgi:fucose permease